MQRAMDGDTSHQAAHAEVSWQRSSDREPDRFFVGSEPEQQDFHWDQFEIGSDEGENSLPEPQLERGSRPDPVWSPIRGRRCARCLSDRIMIYEQVATCMDCDSDQTYDTAAIPARCRRRRVDVPS